MQAHDSWRTRTGTPLALRGCMLPTESAASHEIPRSSRAGLIALYIAVGIAVVVGLGIAGMFAYPILGPMLGVEAY